jgi:hypothetical protein
MPRIPANARRGSEVTGEVWAFNRRSLTGQELRLHHRPLLPLTGCGGWSERLEQNPPDERGNSRILAWASIDELEGKLRELGLVGGTD